MGGVEGVAGTIGRGAALSLRAANRREPAPGGLELVRAFLNSSDIEAGADELATFSGVEAWLRSRNLPLADPRVPEADQERLVAVREALRDLITCRDRGDPDDAALYVLAEASRSSPLTVAFNADGQATLLSSEPGVNGAIGRLLGEISAASIAGTWSRLKVCRNDACRWAYYDASRNHSGIWCSMAICGNRAKGRALRVRRRTDGTVSS